MLIPWLNWSWLNWANFRSSVSSTNEGRNEQSRKERKNEWKKERRNEPRSEKKNDGMKERTNERRTTNERTNERTTNKRRTTNEQTNERTNERREEGRNEWFGDCVFDWRSDRLTNSLADFSSIDPLIDRLIDLPFNRTDTKNWICVEGCPREHRWDRPQLSTQQQSPGEERQSDGWTAIPEKASRQPVCCHYRHRWPGLSIYQTRWTTRGQDYWRGEIWNWSGTFVSLQLQCLLVLRQS